MEKLKSIHHALMLIVFLLAFPSLGYADAFSQDGLYFEGEPTVVGSASILGGNLIIPESVFYDGKTYKVTQIAARAFLSKKLLTSITIPESVTSIGLWAFANCDNVTTLTAPGNCIQYFLNFPKLKSLTILGDVSSQIGQLNQDKTLKTVTIKDATLICDDAFCGCSSLTSITIPEGVTSIGREAFEGCSGLTSITIPEGVTSIGREAFEGCSGLTSITIPRSVTSIDTDAFRNCSSITALTVPGNFLSMFNDLTELNSLTIFGDFADIAKDFIRDHRASLKSVTLKDGTSIIEDAFYGCSNLTSITIPEGVTSIGEYAFYNCSSLTSITIPEGVTSIGKYAFYNCSSLTSITIPEGVTSIGEYAFSGCNSLTSSITIPEGVTSIENSTFSGCSNLIAVSIPKNVTSIGDYAFDGCTNLQNVNIPTNLTSIGRAAFRNCSSLNQAIAIPKSITMIADETFAGCSKLPSIRLTSVVTSIGNSAFEGCKSIKSFSFPPKISSIGKSAFRYCSDLVSISLSSALNKLGDFAFADCENLESATISSNIEVNYSIFMNDDKLNKWDFKGNYSDGVAIYNTQKTKLIKVMDKSIRVYGLIPETVRKIGEHAFENCTELTTFNVPSYIAIGDSAFLNCEKLEFDSWGNLGSIGNGSFANCRSLKYVNLPSNESIGSSAFAGCSSLETVNIPSVTSIGSSAFAGCSSLETANIESCSNIANSLFKDCSALTRVEIPSYLESIGAKAFMGCKNLTYPWEFLNVTKIGWEAFFGCTSLKKIRIRHKPNYYDGSIQCFAENTIVYVPGGAKDHYQDIMPQCTIYEDYEKDDQQYKDLLSLYNSYVELDYQPLLHEESSWTGENVLTDASQLSANYIDEYEGSLDALVDNSDDTYFLSAWDKENPSKAYHYIQADLKNGYKAFNITFKRRDTNDTSAPTKVHVFVTNTPNDNNSWIDCGNYSLAYNGLEATINSHCYDRVRYMRLQVEATVDNTMENGNLFFALNKLDITPHSLNTSIPKWDDGLYYAGNKYNYDNYDKEFLSGNNSAKATQGSSDFFRLYLSKPIKYVVIKYLKAEGNPTQAMQLYDYSNYPPKVKFAFDADYRYYDNSTGIYCAQFENPSQRLSLQSNDDYTRKTEFWLRSAHVYTRPPKVNLVSEETRTAMKDLLSQYDKENFMRKDDYETFQNYCNEITSLAQTGRYVDFAEHDYNTFYADYPAVVPLLVKAGIVKEKNGELVVDYIYNEGDVIPAHTGVILKGNCRGNAYVMEEGTTNATAPEGNLLHGTIEDEETYVDGCDRYYMLSYDKATDMRLGFYWNGENGPRPFVNKAYKAFLALPASLNAMQMESFNLAEMENGGISTGIVHATTDKDAHIRIGVYSIDGRKVDTKDTRNLPSGVYIVNGKKVVVK